MILAKRIFFLFLLSVSFYAMAQRAPIVKKENTKKINIFFEKVYLHTDRASYNVGEDVWFSAYLVNGKSTYLNSTSNNLYVELISPAVEIIDRKIIRLDQGLGKGDFKLGDSIHSGWYTIRAYTNWMRNFDDDFIFNKRIYVNGDIIARATQEINKPKREETVKQVSVANNTIRFFPEGGNLIEGISSLVAFKTEDANGNAVLFNGSIISSKGDTVSSFKSTDIGMGIFTLTPEKNIEYHVEGFFSNQQRLKFDLPKVLKKGLSMHLTTDSSNIKISISTNSATWASFKNKNIAISIKHAGENCYTGSISLTKENLLLSIPKSELPRGLAVVTLTDYLGRAQCERLFYNADKTPVKFEVKPDKLNYDVNEKVTLTVTAKDIFGQPIKTNFSLAVVENLMPTDDNSIVSYLMLQSEIKGEIKNAGQYFDADSQLKWKQLDLLLLTQGWREYLWRKLADHIAPIKYMPEPGITLTGRLREKVGSNPIPNINITLFGGGFNGDKLFTTKTDKFGNYYFDGLNWNDDKLLKLTSVDEKGKKRGWLILDSLAQPLRIAPIMNPELNKPLSLAVVAVMNNRLAEQRKLTADNAIKLSDVNVTTTKKINLFSQVLTTFGYPDQVFEIKSSDYSFQGLEHYLLTNVLGTFPVPASDTVSTEGILFAVPGGYVRPILMINGKEELTERTDYFTLTMDVVEKVTVKHLLDQSGNDTYLLYLDLKEGALDGIRLDLVKDKMMGYYTARNFYAPSYASTAPIKKDLRTTLFWAPSLQTNEKGETIVYFYNADTKANVAIKAEGITDNGIAVATKSNYKVQ